MRQVLVKWAGCCAGFVLITGMLLSLTGAAHAQVALNPYPVHFDLPRIEVPIIKRGKTRGVLKLTLVAELPNPDVMPTVQANETRYSSAVVKIVAEHFDKLTAGQKELDLDQFKVKFRRRAISMFGEDVIRDILIVNAQIQNR